MADSDEITAGEQPLASGWRENNESGAVADPERIVICAGFAQGLGLILRALAAEGARRGP